MRCVTETELCFLACVLLEALTPFFFFLLSSRVAKFTSIRSLTLFFSHNFGGDTTKINFIGLKGEFSEVREKSTVFRALSVRTESPYGALNILNNVPII